MTRRLATLAAGLAAAAPVCGVAAAPAKLVSQRDQMIVAAACLARVAPAMSAEVLALSPTNDERRTKAKQLIAGRWACMPDRKRAVAVRGEMFLGELAGAMLDRDPAKIDAVAARAAAPARRPATGLSDDVFLVAYSRCLLMAEPAKAAGLLRSQRGSPAERAAVVAFGPALSDCMPTDISYTMNIPDLRAHMAFVAYRSLLGAGGRTDA